MTILESALNPTGRLQNLIRGNRRGERTGIYSICSAHPSVLDAAIQQTKEDRSLLLIESTSSQVNQLGGYTGQTPSQFASFVRAAAQRAGLSPDQFLLGSDHLGPYPWRSEPAATALRKAGDLVRACVLAGYKKVHLDASMACADDNPPGPDEQTIARRAAVLCRIAETALSELPSDSQPPLYVVGTEVPAPGGESESSQSPAVTPADQVARTLATFHAAFDEEGVTSAWERVIALVVQPGVEFGDSSVFQYDRKKAGTLSSALPKHPLLVYEAHSTDYQSALALKQLVEDHFAILKVGPWLTFAFREAVFALSAIEQELLGHQKSKRLSGVRQALDSAMLRNPVYWRSYYHGTEDEIRIARVFSYSDRCRYYWTDKDVQKELALLQHNLSESPLPVPLVSQYFPVPAEDARSGALRLTPEALIREHIRAVLRRYAAACSSRPE